MPQRNALHQVWTSLKNQAAALNMISLSFRRVNEPEPDLHGPYDTKETYKANQTKRTERKSTWTVWTSVTSFTLDWDC